MCVGGGGDGDWEGKCEGARDLRGRERVCGGVVWF